MISKVLRPHNSPGLGTKHKSTFLGRQWEGGGFGYHNQILWFFLAAHFFSSSYNMGILLVSLLPRYPRTLLTYKPHVIFPDMFSFIFGAIGEKEKKGKIEKLTGDACIDLNF